MILIAYDGSEGAKVAIAGAGKLLAGASATVLSVWEPFSDVVARTSAGLSLSPGVAETEELDNAYEQQAQKLAGEGVELASQAGLKAEGRTRTRRGTIAEAILTEAAELDVDAIVMGTRGLTGIKSIVLGSVSQAVLHHSKRPVIIVPPPTEATDEKD